MVLTGSAPVVVQSNNNLVFPAGATSSVAGSAPTIIKGLMLLPGGATPTLTGGVPLIAVQVAPTAATPTLTGGRPLINVTFPPPTIQLTAAGGRPVVGTTVGPGAASSALTGSAASVGVGVTGTPAAFTVTGGTPRVVVTVAPSAANPSVTGGSPLIGVTISPTGGGATLTGGTPIVTNVSNASYISSAAAASSSVAIPAHSIGDLIVIFAFNPYATTAPTKPSAGGTVPNWVYIDNANSASGSGCTTAYFKATATNTTTGTWSNASHIQAVVVRNQNTSSPVGGHAKQAGSSATTTAPSVTMSHTDGSSVLLHFHGHSNLGASGWDAAPAGYTRGATSGTGFQPGTALNYKNITTSDGSVGQTGGQNTSYAAATVEIIN
ncbi:hypothetical protein [Mycobacteroides chelonae]|uniref:hypothetical protein n=1 Tax=Mycobacteroides chelonae TaxID=1774 RepID=UPI0008AA0B93|nr:hypothetical protein BKG63_24115 [Mycobacteroides chelonae]OHU00542.1 hypothetical protein BKG72_03785 [Mycobacteroides chelonae]OLT92955.1 hypothetical protein BKG59_05595 [Mycobacteroides chelonae]